jgi:tetratricopeptide (TPR) repeat protein
MPKRRTEDVIHAIMTDHAIQRRKPARDLLAPGREMTDITQSEWRGEITLLYPARATDSDELELYTAVAQVAEGANLAAGIPRLRNAIQKQHPKAAEFYYELAQAYSRTGQFARALPYFEEALHRNRELTAAELGYAQALIAMGRLPDAIGRLTAAARTDPSVLNALGAAYLSAAQPARAAETLRAAIGKDETLPEPWVNVGNALVQLENTGGAIAALRNAIRLRPGLAAAHGNLASILATQGDFSQARYHFERAIRDDPDDAVTQYNFGCVLVEHNLYAEAEAHLTAALRLNPRLAEASVSLGTALERTGYAEQAIAAYRDALRIKPKLTAAHFNIALALLRRGEKREAKLHFEAVIESSPNDYEAHLHLGEIFLDEKKYDSAIINFQAASQSPKPEVRTAASNALQAARSARQIYK